MVFPQHPYPAAGQQQFTIAGGNQAVLWAINEFYPLTTEAENNAEARSIYTSSLGRSKGGSQYRKPWLCLKRLMAIINFGRKLPCMLLIRKIVSNCFESA